jgi:hypothetical protein
MIAGEVKTAIAIRMLAGGSYLDLVPLFDVSISRLYQVLDDFLDWIIRTLEFQLVPWLRASNWDALIERANSPLWSAGWPCSADTITKAKRSTRPRQLLLPQRVLCP